MRSPRQLKSPLNNLNNGPLIGLEVPWAPLPLSENSSRLIHVVLSELEACSYRNKSPAETAAHIAPLLKKFLPLSSNTSLGTGSDDVLQVERQKDHYSHFILRLAFASTDESRRRFIRLESMLFKFRFQQDDARERREFVDSLHLNWETVTNEEKAELGEALLASTPGVRWVDDESWFKVDWEAVPELIERRSIYVKKGKAYVPLREQLSMILAEFTARLEKAMEVGFHLWLFILILGV